MRHKLLLADDSITIQRVIELTFAEEDVQVLAVGDGKDAIDRIQAERPDIVLADVGMPERDGYEVAAFIKGNPQLAHIPVLLLTGAFEPIDEGRARAAGCDGVLVKPFEPQMVINRVKDLLAGRRPAASGNAGSNGPDARPPAAHDEALTGNGDTPKPGDSLEDYFDRLDAAFATLGGDAGPATSQPVAIQAPSAVASRPATVEDFASWDPDLAGDARRPAAHVAPPPVVQAPAAAVAVAAPAYVSPAAPQVSVYAPASVPVEVPSARVAPPAVATGEPAAAPRGAHSGAPVLVPAGAQFSLAEAFAALLAAEHGQPIAPSASRAAAGPAPEVVEDIVRRVIDRLQDEDMRQTVVDVAERLVREEIDRIKASNG
jgi:CheY-like chemotaxis protein